MDFIEDFSGFNAKNLCGCFSCIKKFKNQFPIAEEFHKNNEECDTIESDLYTIELPSSIERLYIDNDYYFDFKLVIPKKLKTLHAGGSWLEQPIGDEYLEELAVGNDGATPPTYEMSDDVTNLKVLDYEITACDDIDKFLGKLKELPIKFLKCDLLEDEHLKHFTQLQYFEMDDFYDDKFSGDSIQVYSKYGTFKVSIKI